VSLWVRDVEFVPKPRSAARRREPNALQRRKQAEIDELLADGRDRIGRLTEKELLVAGTALYAGEGAKADGQLCFANSDPRMILFCCLWLRRFFDLDETRFRFRLYLHEGLDLDEAIEFWSSVTEIPVSQFGKTYRATPNPSIRKAKHPRGCGYVWYYSTRVHRGVMGLVHALLSCETVLPG
jgi:hypothetical protein